jgi:hypothetical protein
VKLRLVTIVLIVAAAGLAAAAPAGAAWKWSRAYSQSSSSGRAHGLTCHESRFSNWKWHARATDSQGHVFKYRWIERIRHDSTPRHLKYTYVWSDYFPQLTQSQRRQLRAELKSELDKWTVQWGRHNGHQVLTYDLQQAGSYSLRWKPRKTSC